MFSYLLILIFSDALNSCPNTAEELVNMTVICAGTTVNEGNYVNCMNKSEPETTCWTHLLLSISGMPTLLPFFKPHQNLTIVLVDFSTTQYLSIPTKYPLNADITFIHQDAYLGNSNDSVSYFRFSHNNNNGDYDESVTSESSVGSLTFKGPVFFGSALCDSEVTEAKCYRIHNFDIGRMIFQSIGIKNEISFPTISNETERFSLTANEFYTVGNDKYFHISSLYHYFSSVTIRKPAHDVVYFYRYCFLTAPETSNCNYAPNITINSNDNATDVRFLVDLKNADDTTANIQKFRFAQENKYLTVTSQINPKFVLGSSDYVLSGEFDINKNQYETPLELACIGNEMTIEHIKMKFATSDESTPINIELNSIGKQCVLLTDSSGTPANTISIDAAASGFLVIAAKFGKVSLLSTFNANSHDYKFSSEFVPTPNENYFWIGNVELEFFFKALHKSTSTDQSSITTELSTVENFQVFAQSNDPSPQYKLSTGFINFTGDSNKFDIQNTASEPGSSPQFQFMITNTTEFSKFAFTSEQINPMKIGGFFIYLPPGRVNLGQFVFDIEFSSADGKVIFIFPKDVTNPTEFKGEISNNKSIEYQLQLADTSEMSSHVKSLDLAFHNFGCEISFQDVINTSTLEEFRVTGETKTFFKLQLQVFEKPIYLNIKATNFFISNDRSASNIKFYGSVSTENMTFQNFHNFLLSPDAADPTKYPGTLSIWKGGKNTLPTLAGNMNNIIELDVENLYVYDENFTFNDPTQSGPPTLAPINWSQIVFHIKNDTNIKKISFNKLFDKLPFTYNDLINVFRARGYCIARSEKSLDTTIYSFLGLEDYPIFLKDSNQWTIANLSSPDIQLQTTENKLYSQTVSIPDASSWVYSIRVISTGAVCTGAVCQYDDSKYTNNLSKYLPNDFQGTVDIKSTSENPVLLNLNISLGKPTISFEGHNGNTALTINSPQYIQSKILKVTIKGANISSSQIQPGKYECYLDSEVTFDDVSLNPKHSFIVDTIALDYNSFKERLTSLKPRQSLELTSCPLFKAIHLGRKFQEITESSANPSTFKFENLDLLKINLNDTQKTQDNIIVLDVNETEWPNLVIYTGKTSEPWFNITGKWPVEKAGSVTISQTPGANEPTHRQIDLFYDPQLYKEITSKTPNVRLDITPDLYVLSHIVSNGDKQSTLNITVPDETPAAPLEAYRLTFSSASSDFFLVKSNGTIDEKIQMKVIDMNVESEVHLAGNSILISGSLSMGPNSIIQSPLTTQKSVVGFFDEAASASMKYRVGAYPLLKLRHTDTRGLQHDGSQYTRSKAPKVIEFELTTDDLQYLNVVSLKNELQGSDKKGKVLVDGILVRAGGPNSSLVCKENFADKVKFVSKMDFLSGEEKTPNEKRLIHAVCAKKTAQVTISLDDSVSPSPFMLLAETQATFDEFSLNIIADDALEEKGIGEKTTIEPVPQKAANDVVVIAVFACVLIVLVVLFYLIIVIIGKKRTRRQLAALEEEEESESSSR